MPEKLPRYRCTIEKVSAEDMGELNKELSRVGVYVGDVINVAVVPTDHGAHIYEAFFVVKVMY